MITMTAHGTRKVLSVIAAIVIAAASVLILDQAHLAAAPRGTVEVGELELVAAAESAPTTLPAIGFVAQRGKT